jgi:hypothetical protein
MPAFRACEAPVQQHAGPDKADNIARGLRAFTPELYGAWLSQWVVEPVNLRIYGFEDLRI